MKKILLSIATLGVVGAVVMGSTTALFFDEETSTGNTFTAGAVDLRIDNESYYNGELNEGTTWLQPKDLVEGEDFFFQFDDVKPGDWGEDTISIHVDNNNSWLCLDVTLRSDLDNTSNEPELEDEVPYTDDDGELAEAIEFIWWADDGDNVYEVGETLLPSGNLGVLAVDETATIALADSQNNIWGDDGALPGDSVRYIGKAWCFGEFELDPVAQDGDADTNNPTIDPGFFCNGAGEDNRTQTDSFSADLSFQAVQARHQDGYTCGPQDVRGTVIVRKVIEGGDAISSDFAPYTVDATEVTLGVATSFDAGDYVVAETSNPDYAATFSGDCDAQGNITVSDGQTSTCTITNTYQKGTLTVDKRITFTNVAVDVEISDFELFIDDGNGPVAVTDEVPVIVNPGTYTITENYVGTTPIVFDAEFDIDCSDLGQTGEVTLAVGESLTCRVTNDVAPDNN